MLPTLCLYTESFHKLCKSSQKRLDFTEWHVLKNFLPQLANSFTRIYPWHFAALDSLAVSVFLLNLIQSGFSTKMHIIIILPFLEHFEWILNSTIGFPNGSFEALCWSVLWKHFKCADFLKMGSQQPLKSVSTKTTLFYGIFRRKLLFWPISTKWRPPTVIHRWKAGVLRDIENCNNFFCLSCEASAFWLHLEKPILQDPRLRLTQNSSERYRSGRYGVLLFGVLIAFVRLASV